jgi:hypothetical protein
MDSSNMKTTSSDKRKLIFFFVHFSCGNRYRQFWQNKQWWNNGTIGTLTEIGLIPKPDVVKRSLVCVFCSVPLIAMGREHATISEPTWPLVIMTLVNRYKGFVTEIPNARTLIDCIHAYIHILVPKLRKAEEARRNICQHFDGEEFSQMLFECCTSIQQRNLDSLQLCEDSIPKGSEPLQKQQNSKGTLPKRKSEVQCPTSPWFLWQQEECSSSRKI